MRKSVEKKRNTKMESQPGTPRRHRGLDHKGSKPKLHCRFREGVEKPVSLGLGHCRHSTSN
jgi:hypothetical protein